MAKILVIAEQRDGRLKRGSFEVIGAAAAAGNEVHALLMGQDVSKLAAELGQYGASKVHVAEDPGLKLYTAEAYTKVALDVIKAENPAAVLASHTPTGRDLLPHLAASLNVGLASDCT